MIAKGIIGLVISIIIFIFFMIIGLSTGILPWTALLLIVKYCNLHMILFLIIPFIYLIAYLVKFWTYIVSKIDNEDGYNIFVLFLFSIIGICAGFAGFVIFIAYI